MFALRLAQIHVLALAAGIVCAAEPDLLPETQPLTMSGDLSVQMHEAALRYMDATIAESVQSRQRFWRRDLSSVEKYVESIQENRERFQQIIGLGDQRQPVVLERFGSDEAPAVVADTDSYTMTQVRWSVFSRITAEGLLLEPKVNPRGWIVAIPDADQSPEQIAGLADGVPAESQFARRFAENGFCVLVPTLISRSDEGSGNPAILMTNQPHREWIHRQAYMLGRHIIGLEVQKVLAAIDYFHHRRGLDSSLSQTKIGVAGYGEGGLLALYSAAVDPRIDAALVSGYFKSRQDTWQEPIYRNVWGLLREFGDAEIASLVAPRGLVIEYSEEPQVDGPPPVRAGRKNCAAPGRLTTPAFKDVADEFKRLDRLVPAPLQHREFIHGPNFMPVRLEHQPGAKVLAEMLSAPSPMTLSETLPVDHRRNFNPMERQLREVRELDDHIQSLVRDSDQVRDRFFLYKVMPEFENVRWNYELQFPVQQQEKFIEAAKEYRRRFWDDVIGKLEDPLPPLNPRSRKIIDEPTWTGYEVVLDAGQEGFAWGILCLPRNIQPGEKRPVVVCQHGRHGEPRHVIEGDVPAYRNFAAKLAERGFITLAPHNLYQREEHYRTLSRKGNTVKASMFSIMLRHHQQWLSWLSSLPNVDPQRIGFYGLSYGGESAVRIPPLLDGYALSICSGDFNDWTRKVASTHDRKSFMFTDEWEMPYFNMGSTFSYAELTYLMFPRPFMVERGHHDGVSVDSWVASEYAKTRWFYDQFGLGDRTEIEFFNGGHAINGQGTFEFLHTHLNWPKP